MIPTDKRSEHRSAGRVDRSGPVRQRGRALLCAGDFDSVIECFLQTYIQSPTCLSHDLMYLRPNPSPHLTEQDPCSDVHQSARLFSSVRSPSPAELRRWKEAMFSTSLSSIRPSRRRLRHARMEAPSNSHRASIERPSSPSIPRTFGSWDHPPIQPRPRSTATSRNGTRCSALGGIPGESPSRDSPSPKARITAYWSPVRLT